jgi:HK97 family phage major capsid protein
MPYNSLVSRTDAAALIPEDVADGIIQNAVTQSAALSLFRRMTMARNQQRMPVLSALPIAYFVSGDTGLKQTTEQAWANKYLNVEEIAAIVPIPDAVLDDTDFDIWGEIRPRIEEAIGRTLDAAVFFGTNKPTSWPTDIVAAAVAAGNVYARGTSAAAIGGLAEDINQTMGLVEADGFDVNGFVADRRYRARLRSVRDTTGQAIANVAVDELFGVPLQTVAPGLWPSGLSAAELIAGDWTQGVLAVRQDITYKFLTEAVIQDSTGAIVYNLAQQDMTAMRVVFRCAWQVANPLTYEQQTEANRYPFAVLRSPAA